MTTHALCPLWIALVLTGCATDPGIGGTWEGECVLDSSGTEAVVQVELMLEQDGDEVTGTATAQPDWLMETVSGAVTGAVDGDQVDLSMSLGDAAVSFDLDLDGTWAGEELSGPCSTEVEQGTFTAVRTQSSEELEPG
jgi:hypothetical protein